MYKTINSESDTQYSVLAMIINNSNNPKKPMRLVLLFLMTGEKLRFIDVK